MCISSNQYTEKHYKIDFTKLEYNKTPEEELETQQLIATAESWLNSLGIETRVGCDYFRHFSDILEDLGEYLYKNNLYTPPSLATASAIAAISEET